MNSYSQINTSIDDKVIPEGIFLRLATPYYMMLLFLIIYGGLACFDFFTQNADWPKPNFLHLNSPSIVFAVGLISGNKFFRYQLQRMKEKDELKSKITQLTVGLFAQYLLLAIPAIWSVMMYWKGGGMSTLMMLGITFILYLKLRPTRKKIERHLDDIGTKHYHFEKNNQHTSHSTYTNKLTLDWKVVFLEYRNTWDIKKQVDLQLLTSFMECITH